MARRLRRGNAGRQDVLTPEARRRLRRALLDVAPWLDDPEVGPRTVDAGRCDRCGSQPRLASPCGPEAGGGLCRDCVIAAGVDAWCAGHVDLAAHVLDHARRLPDHWADAVILWWVSTGELAVDGTLGDRAAALSPTVVAALEACGDDRRP